MTITIAPVKFGGFGKAPKGTIQSGVVKKTSNVCINTENPKNGVLTSFKKPASAKVNKQSPKPLTNSLFLAGDNSTNGDSAGCCEAGGDDDDLPQDWRPPPEVLAKMTSGNCATKSVRGIFESDGKVALSPNIDDEDDV